MKKILLIGELDSTLEDVNGWLAEEFTVQLCSCNVKLIDGMIKISKPDLAVIHIMKTDGTEKEIFNLFSTTYPHIPVLVIGAEGDSVIRQYQGLFNMEQFQAYFQSIAREEILRKCCDLLSVSSGGTVENDERKSSMKKRILAVDDSAFTLRSIKAMLEEKYTVVVATSCEMALKSIEKRRPDLILLDYEMPGRDGKETLEMIRADKEIADIPVIFLTAVADREQISAVLHLEPAGYVLKPLEKDKLLGAIRKVIS